MREYVFDPLQMHHSTAYATQAHNLAQGHTIFLGFPQKLAQPYQLSEAPAGFLVSTAEDLGHYLTALADAGVYDGVSVISSTSIETMQNPPAGH